MKTGTQFFSLIMIVFLIGVASETTAQGRGHHHDNKDRRGEHHDKYDRDDHREHNWKEDRYGHKDEHRKHAHYRHGHHPSHRHAVRRHEPHHHHAPVVVRHYHERPRYIYYRDYDVYYDYHRDVYITWSGRNWAVSASLPVVLHRVDRRRAVRMEVDYVRDDFPTYLQTRRPVYTRVYTEF